MTHQAALRFYAELTDFLPQDLRSGTVTRGFEVPGSVKDVIEACGIPHTEVDLIVANGRSVDFSYLVNDGDRVSVFPVFESSTSLPSSRSGRSRFERSVSLPTTIWVGWRVSSGSWVWILSMATIGTIPNWCGSRPLSNVSFSPGMSASSSMAWSPTATTSEPPTPGNR